MSEILSRLATAGLTAGHPAAGLYEEAAAEIVRLTAELDEAVAIVNERDEASFAIFQTLIADIDAWHASELAEGRDVPDFWDDCRTSEWLASHLISLGYVREPALLAAIQTHHDTKHGRAGGRSAAVLVAGDRALYEAAGVKHAVLGFDAGALDEVRRAPARALRPAAQKIADGLNEALDYVNNAATKETTNV